jgi:hypothetical protein
MLIIAHRGLVAGPNPQQENDPDQISHLLQAGWHVEVDVRREHHNWCLGHHVATHVVDIQFLLQPHLWLHVKDVTSAHMLAHVWRDYKQLNFFWHEHDARTWTSQGYWWTEPGHVLTPLSVAVMPETHEHDLHVWRTWGCAGICTDWGSQLT